MILFRRLPLLLFVLLFSSVMIHAQDECPSIVQDALDAVGQACLGTERNQACYGNGQIDLIPQTGAVIPSFETAGDLATISDIQTLTLYPLDLDERTWGVSMMLVQANLPDTLPGQNVSVVLFGDSELNIDSETDAFYFQGGIGQPACAEAPDGLLIQTPEGQGMIDLTLNGVDIQLGSTAYITAEAGNELVFNLLEGNATATVAGETQTFEGGQFVSIAMDDDLIAIDAPSEPQEIDFTTLPDLPYVLLPNQDVLTDLNADGMTQVAGDEGNIIPLSGNWTYINGDVEAVGADCPPGFAEMLASSIPIAGEAFTDFGGQAVNLEALFASTGDPIPAGAIIGNPEPNIYTISFAEDGMTMNWQMQVESESNISGFWTFDMSGGGFACEINISYSVELAE